MGRSNDNCYRTRANCPRCHSRWGTPESGLQPYEYTFFMQGLKTYVCCGCLLQFGCMTAEHHCPHVSRPLHDRYMTWPLHDLYMPSTTART